MSWRTGPHYCRHHQTHRSLQVAGFGHVVLTGREPCAGNFKNVPKAAEEVVASSGTTTQEILVLVQASYPEPISTSTLQ